MLNDPADVSKGVDRPQPKVTRAHGVV